MLLVIIFLAILFPRNVFAADSPVINEIVVHPGSGNQEWIELYNSINMDVSEYWIDDDASFVDDAGSSAKKQLTGVGDAKYAVFSLSSSIFNNSGDHVVLFDQSGEIVDQYEYNSDPGVDVSIGRSPNGTGQFTVLATETKGIENSNPFPTPTLTPTPSTSSGPTAKPTKVPTPTKIPTPIKSGPTPTRTPTPTKTSTQIKVFAATSTKIDDVFVPYSEASGEAQPTSILGASTSAAPTKSIKSEKRTLVDAATKNNSLNGMFFIIGSIFLASCGILVYRRKMTKADE